MKLLTAGFTLLATLSLLTQDAPFKPKDQFEVRVELKLRQRPGDDDQSNMLDTRNLYLPRNSVAQLPFLILHIRALTLNENETRVRIVDNNNKVLLSRKTKVEDVLKLDVGFTDDVKARTTAHAFTVQYLDADKKTISRIYLFIAEDGKFFVNDEQRGKF